MTITALERLAQLLGEAAEYADATGEPTVAAELWRAEHAARRLADHERTAAAHAASAGASGHLAVEVEEAIEAARAGRCIGA